MTKILLATSNPGKFREFCALMAAYPFMCIAPPDLGLKIDVPEIGDTYEENAGLKATAYLNASGLIVLADDTGLEVDLLDGRPGLHSARYSVKPGATDADRRVLLIDELLDKPKPWRAHFHCCVAVALPGRENAFFNGDVSGEIIEAEAGEHGFGYDRIFWVHTAGRRLAELSMDEKNIYSHRAVAVNKAIPYLLRNLDL